MGARKRIKAERIKEEKRNKAFAILRNNPTSPRKMRLVVDLVRGKQVNEAIDILRFTPNEPTIKLEKLILSALANWQAKNEGVRIEDANLYVKEIFVDEGRMLKRIKPAAQGRAHRIRKRSNHVTVVLDSAVTNDTQNTQS
ncbi:MAG TPA: 50S ribosomal protein L22 [Perlabentimonas sp.]|jgi:large subunit ribosomal protein L22|nr:50S ribosomal protein L22 [Bacteroidales bacterium]MDD4672455.1 50S ribosomal protein L22 [Bacteroidales bacterium]MDY0347270.1 50S ribosomal protein L22 [Tenuifilaceae bacterium]HZJ74388.1 50S ribosomal protein L22 [Perlabentimonas sp.]